MVYSNNPTRGGYGGSPNRAYEPPVSLPAITFYEDAEKSRMRRELVDAEALQCALAFAPGDARNGIKASQLRKFYAEVKSLELAWKTRHEDFNTVAPRIKLLKAKVSYALGRRVVPASFKNWLCACVDKVNDGKDFVAFLLHFEAVVGFAYGEGLKD